ncbi:pseudaminic acid biosynthesis-associated methylase [Thiofilum flexile]|uniref:pseudaminic acid biosynthesis-associated methylase n=1 Tax=Thiofilum flexile TaxID=125627 RepID=UPI000366A9FC|nr:pseudaminic acid biosynthesis-associated methylase [Thiofilum flexile]
MSQYKTEQELFWATEFGDEYSSRNIGNGWIASNTALFSKILSRTTNVKSLIEFGSNIGLNLRSIKNLAPDTRLAAIEINSTAITELKKWAEVNKIYEGSILDVEITEKYDLAFIKGVLIHINPEHLRNVYEKLYQSSSKYICLIEYYNPSPVTINYRGHNDRLFKRDFAGEMLDIYPDLKLVDYGFVYRRDPNFPQDDATWFLLEKTL